MTTKCDCCGDIPLVYVRIDGVDMCKSCAIAKYKKEQRLLKKNMQG